MALGARIAAAAPVRKGGVRPRLPGDDRQLSTCPQGNLSACASVSRPRSTGATLADLMTTRRRSGAVAARVRLDLDELDKLQTPADLLHGDLNHFVVLESTAAHAVILDPAFGAAGAFRCAISTGTSRRRPRAHALTSELHADRGAHRKRCATCGAGMSDYRGPLSRCSRCRCCCSSPLLIMPFFLQLTVDEAIGQGDTICSSSSSSLRVVYALDGITRALPFSWVG